MALKNTITWKSLWLSQNVSRKDVYGTQYHTKYSCENAGHFNAEFSVHSGLMRGKHPHHAHSRDLVQLALKPVLITMQIVGCVHEYRLNRKNNVTKMCARAMVLLSFLNFLRLLYMYSPEEKYDHKLLFKLVTHVISGQALLSLLIFYYKVSPRLNDLFQSWTDYKRKFGGVCLIKTRNIAKLTAIAVWTYIFATSLSVASISVLLPGLQLFSQPILTFFYPEENPPPTPTAFVIVFAMGLFLHSWIISPGCFLVLLCCLMRQEFLLFQAQFKKTALSKGNIDFDLERERKQHQHLCKLVNVFEDMFSLYYLMLICVFVASTCIACYTILFPFEVPFILWIYVTRSAYMIVWFLGFFIMITLPASSMTFSAGAPRKILYDLDLSKTQTHVDHRKFLQLQVFMTRVTSGHIGLTAWGMLDVTRGTVVTVVSFVTTVVVILIKFRISLIDTDKQITDTNVPQASTTAVLSTTPHIY